MIVLGAAVALTGAAAIGAVAIGSGAIRIGGATPTTASGPPHFVEEAVAAGLDHTYAGDFTYAVGGGLAVFDCNGDARPDVYVAGGEGPAALYVNDGSVGGPLHF